MAQISSTMLGEMINEELDAPTHLNLAQFPNSIEPSSFMCGQNWHEFLQIHVQISSKPYQKPELCKEMEVYVKNLENIFERKI
jgi:hypothetical protein